MITLQQEEIVKSNEGNYLIVAGAGSGKTYTLTQRLRYLVSQGIDPNQIIAISFTRKASMEIKSRTIALMPNTKGIKFGTFHSICLRILKKYSNHLVELGLIKTPSFSVIDTSEQNRMIERYLIKVNSPLKHEDIKSFFSTWGKETDYPIEENMDHQSIAFFYCWRTIKDEQFQLGYIDFDDILKITYLLMKKNESLKKEISSSIRYLLIDEAQDLNKTQINLIAELSSYWGNCMLIGDDYQSIYRFRGSQVENFIEMIKKADVQTLFLEQNFRSAENIVKASNSIISNNRNQIAKQVYSNIPMREHIHEYSFDDKEQEAKSIIKLLQENNYPLGEMAVLFRNRKDALVLEKQLIMHKIPYAFYGKENFFERPFIKLFMAYIRLIISPYDELALEKILLNLKGVGDFTVNLLVRESARNSVILPTMVMGIEKVEKIPLEGKRNIHIFWESFFKNISEISRDIFKENSIEGSLRMVYRIMESIPRKRFSSEENDFQMLLDLADKQEGENEVNSTDIKVSLDGFIHELLLYEEGMEKAEKNMELNLMTIHSSKGLEFSTVFIIGLEQDNFPSSFAVSEEEVCEERRIMYVAMTRAKEKLNLCYCRKKDRLQREPYKKSQFLEEIPAEKKSM